MSLIPAFEIGLWNTWIFMVAWVFFHMLPLTWPIFRYDIKAMWFILLAYSVFLPLPLGTPLLYTGIALFAVGLIIFEIAMISWMKTAIDEPITTGLYRYSRHPIYIGVFVQYIGIGIVSASGLFLLLIVISIALSAYTAPAEERFCLDKYGDTYRQYINRTPRWIGIPKS